MPGFHTVPDAAVGEKKKVVKTKRSAAAVVFDRKSDWYLVVFAVAGSVAVEGRRRETVFDSGVADQPAPR